MNPEREKRRKRWRALRTTAQLSTIGLTLALSVGIGIGIGIWLENRYPRGGAWVIGFSLLGIVAGFQQLVRGLIQAGREADAEERSRRQSERDDRDEAARDG